MSSGTPSVNSSAAGRWSFLLTLFLTAGIALFAVSPSPAGAAGTGSISGLVTDSSDRPLEEGCVWLYDSGGNEVKASSTALVGKYEFDRLEPGDYRLKFDQGCFDISPNNVLGEFYDNEETLAEATPITVSNDSETVADAQLALGGSISGKVTDGAGDPVRWYCPRVFDSGGTIAATARTEKDGTYSVVGLETGDYRLEFWRCGQSINLLDEFYEDEETLAEASSISVTEGSDVPNVDAQLAPGGWISGTIRDSSGNPLDDVCAEAYDSEGNKLSKDTSDPEGVYKLVGLETGDYRIEFSQCYRDLYNVLGEFYGDKATLAEATPVAVTSGAETPDIDTELATGGSISGTIKLGASRGTFGGPCLAVYDSAGEQVEFDTLYNADQRNADYTVDALPTGDYRIEFQDCTIGFGSGGCIPDFPLPNDCSLPPALPSEFYDNEETLENATPISVTAGSDSADIDALLGNRGAISGNVTDSNGDPLAGVCPQPYDSSGKKAGHSIDSDANGDYTVFGLEPGSYKVKFRDCDFESTNAHPEFYGGETLATATPITVAASTDTQGIDAQLGEGGVISGTITTTTGEPLDSICVLAYDSAGDEADLDIAVMSAGHYELAGLSTGGYRLYFHECIRAYEERRTVTPEYYEDKSSLGQATPVEATAGTEVTGIDAQLETTFLDETPPDDPPPGNDPPEGLDPPGTTTLKAAISKVSVKGPAKVKKGKKAVYRVKITNGGNTAADGVTLGVKGRGASSGDAVGSVPAGATKTVKVRLKPRKAGKVKIAFKVSSSNAGGKSVKRTLTVRR